jgi:hypothetical protein
MLWENLAISVAMIVLCVAIHGSGVYGLTHVLESDRAKPWREGRPHRQGVTVILTIFGLLALHSIEIWAYAFLYEVVAEFDTLETSLYFSATTFTTLGFGDVTLDPGRRLIAGTEGLIGLILIGWSTAILVSLTTRMNDVRFPGRRSRSGEAPQGRNSP